jgi:hypothetical protein
MIKSRDGVNMQPVIPAVIFVVIALAFVVIPHAFATLTKHEKYLRLPIKCGILFQM